MRHASDPHYRNLPSYLRVLPDGRIMDTRYQFGRGARVRITDGPLAGLSGTVESCVWVPTDYRVAMEFREGGPGYHIRLDNDEMATCVRWDWVEALSH